MNRIGLIGGTGFYDFFEGEKEEIEIKTKYGSPSDKLMIGNLFGKEVVFLPRHGKKHEIPPHKIPYQANIFALKELGVDKIIAPAAVGSMNKDMKPGDFVICDQFIDQTKTRKDTFFDGPRVAHLEMAYPYCSFLRKLALDVSQKLNIKAHSKGTVVVIEGPRFSTLAESLCFSKMGGDLVNMTQYPEVVLAQELGICYLNISLVTDYDAGVYAEGGSKPVSIEEVLSNFKQNTGNLKSFVLEIIKEIGESKSCSCEEKSKRAFIN